MTRTPYHFIPDDCRYVEGVFTVRVGHGPSQVAAGPCLPVSVGCSGGCNGLLCQCVGCSVGCSGGCSVGYSRGCSGGCSGGCSVRCNVE